MYQEPYEEPKKKYTGAVNLDEIMVHIGKKHNSKLSELPDYPRRILVVGSSESRKSNFLKFIASWKNIDEFYIHVKKLLKK